eukprot:UN29543
MCDLVYFFGRRINNHVTTFISAPDIFHYPHGRLIKQLDICYGKLIRPEYNPNHTLDLNDIDTLMQSMNYVGFYYLVSIRISSYSIGPGESSKTAE